MLQSRSCSLLPISLLKPSKPPALTGHPSQQNPVAVGVSARTPVFPARSPLRWDKHRWLTLHTRTAERHSFWGLALRRPCHFILLETSQLNLRLGSPPAPAGAPHPPQPRRASLRRRRRLRFLPLHAKPPNPTPPPRCSRLLARPGRGCSPPARL